MNKLDQLIDETNRLVTKHSNGETFTAAEADRLRALPALIEAESKNAADVERGEDILRKLSGGAEAKNGKTSQDRRLTAGAFKSAARDLAGQIKGQAAVETKAATLTGYSSTLVGVPASTLPQVPASALDALTMFQYGDRFVKYLRTTDRTMNAAVVAPGEVKPESDVSFELVQEEMRVIATTSGRLDEYLLRDAVVLEQIISAELMLGVQRTIERQVFYGAGSASGELPGIALASGVQTVSTGASPLLRLRRAVGALENLGFTAGVIVMHPDAWEAIETSTTAGGEFVLGNAGQNVPVVSATRQAWGVQVATSTQVPVGEALVLDLAAVGLASDGAVRVNIGAPGDAFLTNELVVRVETRAYPMLMQPLGVVRVTLNAA